MMNQLFNIILLFTLVHGLTYFDGEKSHQIDSPRIHVGKFVPAVNLTLRIASKDGCSENDYDGASVGEVWVTSTGFCSLQNQITKAHKAGVRHLITVWTDNGQPGLNVRAGAIGLNIDSISVFEITNKAGKGIMACEYCAVNITMEDTNVWLDFFDGPGIIIWQVILTIPSACLIIYTVYKLIILNATRERMSKYVMATFPLIMVLFSTVICICYITVDPMRANGIYGRETWTLFQTMYLPGTFMATFFITISLWQTFKNKNILKSNDRLDKILKVFRGASFVAFAIDFCLSIARGFIYDPSLGYFSAITIIYYCLAAIFIIILYTYTVLSYFSTENKSALVSGKGMMGIKRFLIRNIWIFSVLYFCWMCSSIVATAYLSNNSVYRTPASDALVYFFPYLTILCINAFHVIITKTPENDATSSNTNQTNTSFTISFSKTPTPTSTPTQTQTTQA